MYLFKNLTNQYPWLQKELPPLVNYGVLFICLAVALFLVYEALTSPLLFWSKEETYTLPPFRLSRQEYREELLTQAPAETIVIGPATILPTFKEDVDDYDDIIKEASRKYKVDCTLIKATMLAESRGKRKAKSSQGAIGLMQLMPATARRMGFSGNLTDPRVSIMAGTKYMAHLKQTACHEKPVNAVCDVNRDSKYRLAAYNGGSKCNRPGWGECTQQTRWECIYYDAYAETRQYVNRVKANYHYLKDRGWDC